MFRRDYMLVQAEEFGAFLAKFLGFTSEAKWEQATTAAEGEFQRLVALDPDQAVQLTETELFARAIEGEPTQLAHQKVFMLATLFKVHGDALATQDDTKSRAFYLKGLNLLFDMMNRTSVRERPDFVPTVESFVIALGDAVLPIETTVKLMQHYEEAGEFAKAEDTLFAIADVESPGKELLDFGIAFYGRLAKESEAALANGNFSRAEMESGLAEFRAKISRPA